ncbi:hypothetical protein A1F94_001621 [Pyrenophora tritici-repentis]|uniref:Uncharacterized protein n=1 Tax=Pyrenophora tritici-repentis TaxID=45151 RepID=A0A2W1DH72_9PLEO|nr:hypothetical protein PtrV1_02221 [Pyrenophora tritici-repentis]KAF7454967.1 hypothetical protein A1F99_022250 [Pyrenophora tritici-repentis]KAF7578122.1 hypothetical protein PtrM4_023620 [Pyrenophora tritici-repentis]KAG9388728.1 hypothetical protein A1F94_001621 [Pyrenophora tritici-repentis]KAI0571257.1 hypothetical protein Alg215_10524 [Pyrenophora tritici-repentis]
MKLIAIGLCLLGIISRVTAEYVIGMDPGIGDICSENPKNCKL